MTSPYKEWVARLEKFRPELRELSAELLKTCANETQHGREPRFRFAREWNRVLDRGDLDKERLSAMQQTWSRMEGLLQAGRQYRDQIAEFARRCGKDPRLAKSQVYDQPKDVVAERLQRAVIGVADAIERRMPQSVRKSQMGDVELNWTESAGRLDAVCSWKANPDASALKLLAVARVSMQRFAELSLPDSDAFADLLLRNLQSGTLDLPDFGRVQSDDRQTLLRWQPESAATVALAPALFSPQRLPAEDGASPQPIEFELWKRFPRVAEVVDQVLCAAAMADYERAVLKPFDMGQPGAPCSSEEPPAVSQVVQALQELTGRPAEDVILLLTPLLQQRVHQDSAVHHECAGYLNALTILWSLT